MCLNKYKTLKLFLVLTVFTWVTQIAPNVYAKDCLDSFIDYGKIKPSFVAKHRVSYSNELTRTGPILNQCSLGTCHIHAWVSVLQDQFQRTTGRPLRVSAEFLSLRHWLRESLSKLDSLEENPTQVRLGANSYSSRMAIKNIGVIPEGVWKPLQDITRAPVSSRITEFIQNIIGRAQMRAQNEADLAKRKKVIATAKEEIEALFVSAVGAWPKDFVYEGQKYTPDSFTRSYFPDLTKPTVYLAINSRPNELTTSETSVVQTYVKTQLSGVESVLTQLIDKGASVYLSYEHNASFVDRDSGVMSISAFNTTENGVPLSRSERSRLKITDGGHAVQVIGYDRDPHSGQIIKWKIKNSWGEKLGDHGFFHMYSDYFRAYATGITFFANDDITLPVVDQHILRQQRILF